MSTEIKHMAAEVFAAISGYVRSALVPFTTRLDSQSHRISGVEARVVQIGKRFKSADRIGVPGPTGPPGPVPAHRWTGTALQFEQAPGGVWGEEVDLKGPPGEQGKRGRSGGGGVGATPPVQNSYFPAGWS
jgi:hypothetical protein